jgi:cell division protein ZapA (FtsZ GTPase activity inhibitor)
MDSDHSGGVVVDILDRKYTFAGSDDMTSRQIAEVAALVDERLRRVQSVPGSRTPWHTAIIAALELIDELFGLRQRYQSTEADIAMRTSRLTSSLGKLLQDVGPRWPSDIAAERQAEAGWDRQHSSAAEANPAREDP